VPASHKDRHKGTLREAAPILDEEDKATLAAIDEDPRDAQDGRNFSASQIREFAAKSIPAPLHRKNAKTISLKSSEA